MAVLTPLLAVSLGEFLGIVVLLLEPDLQVAAPHWLLAGDEDALVALAEAFLHAGQHVGRQAILEVLAGRTASN